MDIKINKKYKDRLFCLRFGREEYKKDALILYNALNNTEYNDIEQVKITTIDDVIYIKMKNDVSLLINGNISLWEQQSSINKNMPVRGLMYFGNLYSQYITQNKFNLYGSRLIKIPNPQYIVFYNGTAEEEAIKKLKLSDAFIHETKSSDFEWTATVYNLNKGKNDDLLDKCRPLREYMTLVNRIRENSAKGMKAKEAVNKAVDSCIKEGIMEKFLIKHKAEVLNVCLTEFDEKVYEDSIREEGREEGINIGRSEGINIGRSEGIIKTGILLKLPKEKIIQLLKEQLNVDIKTAEKYFEEYNK